MLEDNKLKLKDALVGIFLFSLVVFIMYINNTFITTSKPSVKYTSQDSIRIAQDAVSKCIYIIDTTSVNKGMYLTLKHRYERVLADSLLK